MNPKAHWRARQRFGVRQPSAALVFNASAVFEPGGFMERRRSGLRGIIHSMFGVPCSIFDVSSSFMESLHLQQWTCIGTMNQLGPRGPLPLRHEVGERVGVWWCSGLRGKRSPRPPTRHSAPPRGSWEASTIPKPRIGSMNPAAKAWERRRLAGKLRFQKITKHPDARRLMVRSSGFSRSGLVSAAVHGELRVPFGPAHGP